jgi:hypothetical protein
MRTKVCCSSSRRSSAWAAAALLRPGLFDETIAAAEISCGGEAREVGGDVVRLWRKKRTRNTETARRSETIFGDQNSRSMASRGMGADDCTGAWLNPSLGLDPGWQGARRRVILQRDRKESDFGPPRWMNMTGMDFLSQSRSACGPSWRGRRCRSG